MTNAKSIHELGDLLDTLRGLSALVESTEPPPLEHYWLDDDGSLLHESIPYCPDDVLAEAVYPRDATLYTKEIRGIARMVWQGKAVDATRAMWGTVSIGLNAAWNKGAASCGILPGDLTMDEVIRRDMIIIQQRGYIAEFLTWVYTHRRDGPSKLLWRQIQPRVNMWGNAWNRSFNEAKVRACANQPTRWVLHGRHRTKQPCSDCLKMNGRVYRASVWSKHNIFPQSPNLACKGFNCGCMFFAAPGAKLNKGKPPRLSGQ